MRPPELVRGTIAGSRRLINAMLLLPAPLIGRGRRRTAAAVVWGAEARPDVARRWRWRRRVARVVVGLAVTVLPEQAEEVPERRAIAPAVATVRAAARQHAVLGV